MNGMKFKRAAIPVFILLAGSALILLQLVGGGDLEQPERVNEQTAVL